MNDFTKDELEEILGWSTVYCIGASDMSYKISVALMDKIQSLIDNHPKCDHRSGMNHYNEKGEAVGYDSAIYRCRHCDILFRFTFENGQCVGSEELE